MDQWYNCSKCGRLIQWGQPLCASCGTPLTWPEPASPVTAMKPTTPDLGNREMNPSQTFLVIMIVFLIAAGIVGVILSLRSNPETIPAHTETSLTVTSEERSYALKMSANTKNIGAALTSISEMAQSPQIGNASWEAAVGAKIDLLQSNIKEGKAIMPPSSLASVHAEYIQMLNHLDRVCSLLDRGLRTYSADLIEQAGEEMTLAGPHGQEALRLINEFNSARGIY